ncbi:MAG: hypothetical protein MUC97_01420 [Bernardetiaceae bacterium]|jgi:hypothetical protein|nr:hypothetical protein [Bernardetiaceae bacterium]
MPALAQQVFKGTYNGSNVFLYNPARSAQNLACVQAVALNGKAVAFVPQSTLEIDLSGLERDDTVEIVVNYLSNCPALKLLNPKSLDPAKGFRAYDLRADAHLVTWQGLGECVGCRYFLESFQNNHWQVVNTLTCDQARPSAMRQLPVLHIPGLNRYRLRYFDTKTGRTHYSTEAEFTLEKLVAHHQLYANVIGFSETVAYEILNEQHQAVAKGVSDEVDCSQLADGRYFVVYHNKIEQVNKINGQLKELNFDPAVKREILKRVRKREETIYGNR